MSSLRPCARIVPLFRTAPATPLAVAPALDAAWGRLPAGVRDHLTAFLADQPATRGAIVAPDDAPASFADDLATGGAGLRAAFPAIARRVEAIDDAGRRVTVRIACEATHDGAFFGFMLPTGRAVQFDELHHLRVEGGVVVEDRLAIDLRAIIRQLGSAPAAASPPSA